ncbi:MAG: hypothetical protein GXO28_04230 [Methanopyri archaeon]|nr:hypothetical protein [Methanopyri archaeon]
MRRVGVDTGSTHVDVVVVEDGEIVEKRKEPHHGDIESGTLRALEGVEGDEVRVSTTLPINELLSRGGDPVHLVLVPGPGLNPRPLLDIAESYEVLPGYVDHRGDVVKGVGKSSGAPDGYAVAVCVKYSTRNSEVEREIAPESVEDVTFSHHCPHGSFPERVATAVLGAKIRRITREFLDSLPEVDFVVKGDGGVQSREEALRVPVNVLHSGPAAGGLGAVFLTGKSNLRLLDVGGATVDVIDVEDGAPVTVDGAELFGYRTTVRAADVKSVPLGGNVVVGKDGRVIPERVVDTPASLGGSEPTVTDALVVEGLVDGDYDVRAARRALERLGDPREIASEVVSTLEEGLRPLVEGSDRPVFWAGTLAPAVRDLVGRGEVVPHHDVCNAVGCAVAGRSREATVYINTEEGRGHVVPVGESFEVPKGRTLNDVDAVELASDAAGFDPDEVEVRVFDVVRGAVRVGSWAVVRLYQKPRVEPV